MEELLYYMVKSIVTHPEDVHVEKVEGEKTILLELTTAPQDRGIVIGKQGKTADSIRVILNALGFKLKKRVKLEIAC